MTITTLLQLVLTIYMIKR